MFILIRLIQHISSIIMLIVRRTDYIKNCMWCMPCCGLKKIIRLQNFLGYERTN